MPYNFLIGNKSNYSEDPSKKRTSYQESLRTKLTMDPKAMFLQTPPSSIYDRPQSGSGTQCWDFWSLSDPTSSPERNYNNASYYVNIISIVYDGVEYVPNTGYQLTINCPADLTYGYGINGVYVTNISDFVNSHCPSGLRFFNNMNVAVVKPGKDFAVIMQITSDRLYTYGLSSYNLTNPSLGDPFGPGYVLSGNDGSPWDYNPYKPYVTTYCQQYPIVGPQQLGTAVDYHRAENWRSFPISYVMTIDKFEINGRSFNFGFVGEYLTINAPTDLTYAVSQFDGQSYVSNVSDFINIYIAYAGCQTALRFYDDCYRIETAYNMDYDIRLYVTNVGGNGTDYWYRWNRANGYGISQNGVDYGTVTNGYNFINL